MTRHYPDLGDAFDWLKQILHVARPIRSTAYNGGQKCWDLSSDITKTSDPSPPTPNKVEFGAKWVKMSALFGHIIARGSGRTTVINPKPNKKLSVGAESYVKIAWKGFSHSPKFFCPPL